MKKVLVPLADGFEEIEAVTIIDVLRRAGVQVTVAGVRRGELKGSRQIGLVPDTDLDQIRDESFDMIVLPGGQPGVDHLREDPRILEILRKMKKEDKLIGAICAAPLALRDAGILSGARLTSHPSVESELDAHRYEKGRVVVDGKLITSRGPGTAMEFALKLVEVLVGGEKVRELASAMLARE